MKHRVAGWLSESRAITFVATSLLAACGASAGNSTGGPASTESAQERVAPASEVPAPTYSVHEWGLVRANAQDQIVLSGPHHRAPPGVTQVPMTVRKPVLYFHVNGSEDVHVNVGATMIGGTMLEHWPLVPSPPVPSPSAQSPNSLTTIDWSDVVLHSASCAGARYPSMSDPACRVSDGVCETADLRTVETRDAACVTYGGESWNNLFYRGIVTSPPALPLTIEARGTEVTVRLAADASTIPGQVIRISPQRTVTLVSAPAPGASVLLHAPSAAGSEGIAALRATLIEGGLTADEADAFGRAWNDELFAPAASAGRAISARGPRDVRGAAAPRDSILYVLPADAVERFSTLQFDPPPTEVRRVMVVWADVPGVL